MSGTSRKIFMTPRSSRIAPLTSDAHNRSFQVPVKTSLYDGARCSWVTIVMALIAFTGILGAAGIALVSFVFLPSTTLSTSTTTTTTTTTTTSSSSSTTTTTTTPTMCFTMPTPRPTDVWLSVNPMSTSRVYHTSTLISQDNSVLIAGGSDGAVILSSVQKYIPSTGCFQTMRDMSTTRYLHTADQLSSLSGFVLIAGGCDNGGAVIGVADLYHPITADIITIYLSVARYQHKSAIISQSQLVLIGGYTAGGVMVASSDMLDTSTNSGFQTGTNTMAEAHVDHTAIFLNNISDIAFIAGGYDGGAIASTYFYQGSSNSFIPLGSGVTMTPARYCHTATYLASPINKVLHTGGTNGAANFGTMFLFDVASLTSSTLTSTLFYPRYFHTATLLPNGKILITGGYDGASLTKCELIDPSNNYTVTLASSLTTGRYYHTATLIPDSDNGTVLVCGGFSSTTTLTNTCELYFV